MEVTGVSVQHLIRSQAPQEMAAQNPLSHIEYIEGVSTHEEAATLLTGQLPGTYLMYKGNDDKSYCAVVHPDKSVGSKPFSYHFETHTFRNGGASVIPTFPELMDHLLEHQNGKLYVPALRESHSIRSDIREISLKV